MVPTILNEASLEELIVAQMIATDGTPGSVQGDPKNFNAAYCLDLAAFREFLRDTQPDVARVVE